VFEGQAVIEVATQHLMDVPVSPAERLGRPVPDTLAAILMMLLEKKPEQRPSSAHALMALLEPADDVEPWSTERARAWWSLRGRPIVERLRRPASVERDESRETHTLVATG